MEYRKRESLPEKGERLYRLTGDSLEMERPDGYTYAISLAEVAYVRIAFAPSRFKTNRHLVTVSTGNGRKVQYDNIHFRGVGDFEDRSIAFSEFTRFLIERVRQHSPGAVLKAGAPPLSYVGQLVFCLGVWLLLATLVLVLPVGVGSFTATALVKLAIIAIFLPILFKWMVKGRPRTVPMDTPLDTLLPSPV